jgi:uncharacterized protein YggE
MSAMKIVVVFFLTALAGMAQTQPARPASVQASATASVSVRPDEARIQIGVITQAATASAAASQNATALQKALDELKAAAGPKAEVKTVSYSLFPNYDSQKARAIKSFTASNIVEIATGDLSSVGKIIDAAAQTGANEVRSLQFTVKDQSQAREQALRKAAQQARSDAEAMAAALGLRLGRVLYLDQTGLQPIRPYTMMQSAEFRAVPTPIEQPQNIEVSATVTLTIALEQ